MHHPTDRITHTMAFVTPVVEHWLEPEIAQWVHTMEDRSDDPSHHEQTLLPRSLVGIKYRLYNYWQLLNFFNLTWNNSFLETLYIWMWYVSETLVYQLMSITRSRKSTDQWWHIAGLYIYLTSILVIYSFVPRTDVPKTLLCTGILSREIGRFIYRIISLCIELRSVT